LVFCASFLSHLVSPIALSSLTIAFPHHINQR